ncbi:paraquat-inducible protein B [Tranquillimonas rosea]|uniref:Paraquat-inducible protein B n=1 Tax=Tranquillimonas rosea TaxID=641238 RepID=A0A1H9VUL4_9RHOB|nr:MlaD family protein [Tranquillimonas rosea]SES25047.1 paraquat-inducible protein B [Tranquillimonas rosea]
MSQVQRPEIKPARRSLRERASIVWIVPLAALLISLGVVWQQYQDRGPLIEIAFQDASGISADETELRYRDVTVGLVETVSFSEGLGSVVVEVRLDKEVAPYVDEAAQFWVVEPEVSARGVRGLNTVLSGNYIEGNWDTEIGTEADSFDGLPSRPVALASQDGLRITLRAADVEGLSEDTPILYRGIEVGSIANLRLSDDGVSVIADGFIRAPEDRLVTSATRFWDTSGFSFSFGAQGAQLNVSSIASLLGGGVSFDTVVSGGQEVQDGAIYELYPGEEAARSSAFSASDIGPTVNVAAVFDEAVSGLSAGAPVEYRGIRVGEVAAITGIVDQERFGDERTRLLATLALRPGKLGLGDDADPEEVVDFIGDTVERGMRAQLQNNSLLSNELKVVLVTIPDAPRESLDEGPNGNPIVPTLPSDLSDITDTAEGVFQRINDLPVEELLASAIGVLDSVNRILNDEDLTRTPAEVVGLISDVRGIVGSDEVQQLPDDAAQLMGSLRLAAEDIESLLETAEAAGAAEALVSALNSAEEAADAVTVAVEDLPSAIEEIEQVAADADALLLSVQELPLDQVVARAQGILTETETLLQSEGVQALPGQVNAAVAEAEGLLADVRSSGVLQTANETMVSVQTAVNDLSAAIDPVVASAEETLNSIDTAVDDVQPVLEEFAAVARSADQLVQNANEVPLDTLAARADALLATVERLLASDGVQALPDRLNGAISEASAVLAQIREGGVIENANQTILAAEGAVRDVSEALMPVLDSARSAAASVDRAAQGVPDIVDQADAIAADLRALTARANELPLEQLVTEATSLVEQARTLVAQDETQALPGTLNAALSEAEGVLSDLREGGVVENTNATLASAERAADAIAQASNELPALVTRMNTLLSQAETTLSGYNAEGRLGSEAQATLRDIREAAQAVDSLARTIERKPNSLLLGR